jgi:hypothetical protein
MMDATIQLLPFRPVKTRMTCKFLLMATMLLIVSLCPQLDAYTLPLSSTLTSRTRKAQQWLPLLMFQQRKRIDKPRIILRAEERRTGSIDDSPKKKRRRKQSPYTPSAPRPQGQITSIEDFNVTEDQGTIIPSQDTKPNVDLTMMNEIANYEFQNKQDDVTINLIEPQQSTSSSSSAVSGAIMLPDIKEARKRKQMEEEIARIQQQQDEQKVKIKRTDKEAFRKVRLFQCYQLSHAVPNSTKHSNSFAFCTSIPVIRAATLRRCR